MSESQSKQFWRFSFLGILFCFSFTESLEAVGAHYEGYFRTRANYYYNLNLDRDTDPNSRVFLDHRFRLNPSFYITDKVRVRSSFNVLDSLMGNAALKSFPHSHPAQAQDRYFDAESGSTVGGIGPEDVASWAYGGVQSPAAASRSTDLKAIQLRRAWLEVDFPIGVLKAGRMPHHLGLGIHANAGDQPNQEVGTTRDRIQFETAISNYYLKPGFGWFHQGGLDRRKQDAFEYFFTLGQQTEDQHIALFVSFLSQKEAQEQEFLEQRTSYWVLDMFLEREFDFAKLSTEAALYAGTFLGQNLFAINAAARGERRFDGFNSLNVTGELGFSSGTSSKQQENEDLRSYPFSRDYHISEIIFREPLPGGRINGESTVPHSSAISNALYGRLKAEIQPTDYFHPSVNLVLPYAIQEPEEAGGRLYGFEYNLVTQWPFQDYFTGELTFAHFLPASFYENTSLTDSVLMLRGGLTVEF